MNSGTIAYVVAIFISIFIAIFIYKVMENTALHPSGDIIPVCESHMDRSSEFYQVSSMCHMFGCENVYNVDWKFGSRSEWFHNAVIQCYYDYDPKNLSEKYAVVFYEVNATPKSKLW